MKVLGKINSYDYVVEISIYEINRIFDNSGCKGGCFNDLIIGQTIDLAAGYNFREDITRVCREMIEAEKTFKKAQETLLKFARMVTAKEQEAEK